MASFTPEIRKYLATDPYTYKVDNIPIEQLQENTIHNLDRILAFEASLQTFATEQWVRDWAPTEYSEATHSHELQTLSLISKTIPTVAQVLAWHPGKAEWTPSSVLVTEYTAPTKETFQFKETKHTGESYLLDNTAWPRSKERTHVFNTIPFEDRLYTAFVGVRFLNLEIEPDGDANNNPVSMVLFPDGLAEAHPRVSIPDGGVTIATWGNKRLHTAFYVAHTNEMLIPVKYDVFDQQIKVDFYLRGHAGGGPGLIFRSGGGLVFTGHYIVKKDVEVVVG